MFESIQRAYELLLPIIENGQELEIFNSSECGNDEEGNFAERCSNYAEGFSGGRPQMENLHLLIKTQILICKRFETEIGKYKYPAYQLVLSCLKLTNSCQEALEKEDQEELFFSSTFFSERRASFIRDSAELIFRTCLVSPLNAEELVSESGIPILYSVFDFFLHAGSLLPRRSGDISDKVSDDEVHEILSFIVHTIAGVAYYESGRRAIESLPSISEFCINWRRCIDGKFLSKSNDSSLKKFAYG